MRKKIGRKIYDTDKSKKIGINVEGSFGNPAGFEEVLYRKGKGDLFLLVSGGVQSQYSEEDVIPLSLDDAIEWSHRVLGEQVTKDEVAKDLVVKKS